MSSSTDKISSGLIRNSKGSSGTSELHHRTIHDIVEWFLKNRCPEHHERYETMKRVVELHRRSQGQEPTFGSLWANLYMMTGSQLLQAIHAITQDKNTPLFCCSVVEELMSHLPSVSPTGSTLMPAMEAGST